VIFLTVLLTDRALRDDNRCATKYGEDWKKYCAIVRFRILPGIL
jgi:7-dehydrocholesterol reductase